MSDELFEEGHPDILENSEPEPFDHLLHFGNYITEAREAKNLSQSQLAEDTKLSASLICKIENGKINYPPSEKAIAALAEVLELDEYLLMVKAGRIPEIHREMVCGFLEAVNDPDKADEILLLCTAAQLVGAEVIIEGNG